MSIFVKLWWLVCVHALTDYVLQPPLMAEKKHPDPFFHREAPNEVYGPWWWWMGAHALINGLGVTYVTQQPLLGIGEAIVHFTLDTLKCQQRISTNQDQVGHLLSKLLWAVG